MHDAFTRGWLCCGWASVAAIIAFSLMPNPPTLDMEQGDKLQHVTAYFALMLWFAQVCRERLRYALGFVALGVVLEVLQGMTGWRSFDLYDMAANTSGVLLGWLAAPPRGPDLHGRMRAIVGARA